MHAGYSPAAAQAVDQRSLTKLLSIEGLSVLKLDLTYPALQELLRAVPLTEHLVFLEIRKLVLKVWMINTRPASPTTIDTSWIRNLLCLPKCNHVEVLTQKPRFTDDTDFADMRRIFSKITQSYVDSTSFDSLPKMFMLDVDGGDFVYDELPFVPFSERSLKTRFATHSGAETFNARIYRLTNAHGGQTFDATTERLVRAMSLHALRIFKDSQL